MPRRNDGTGRFETSICRSSGLSNTRIWEIGAEYFEPFAKRVIIGCGTSISQKVFSEGLSFDANGVPYPEHADIVGWPDDRSQPDEKTKHSRMIVAQRMAPHFRYVPRTEKN